MANFLISGCQRSGTTLLNLMLESHPHIHCFDEGLSYNILAKQIAAPDTGDKLVGYKIPIWTEQLLDRVLDGNELSIVTGMDRVPNFYAHEPIIFMVRNPIDTVSSMIQLKRGNESWLQLVAIPVILKKLANQEFLSKFKTDIGLAISSSDCPIALGALYWKVKTLALLDYQRENLPVHTVFYERLVADPRSVMTELLEFLGARWDDSVLSHHTHQHSQIVDGKAIGDTDPSRPIDTRSVGRSSALLTDSQIKVIKQIAQPLHRQLYSERGP